MDFFDLIFTTNWDDLFERAAAAASVDLPVVGSEIAGDLPPRALVKLHGSTAAPDSLLLTETDIAAMDTGRPRLWRAVRDALRTRPLVVVGSSLRDPSIVRLFTEAKPQVGGWFVGPQMFATTQRRLKAWNLECLAADADAFFESLTRAIERRPV